MAVTSQAAPATARPSTLASRSYYRLLAVVVLAIFVFRTALGARGSFTGDDFGFRAATAAGFPWGSMFEAHNGHLNPVGLVAQWAIQQAFPGRYVPLMILSAALVAGASWLVGVWSAEVFGHRYVGLLAAGFVGLALLQLELATWWSVALYAAPLLVASALLILLTTRYVLGSVAMWAPLVALVLALLCSTKAVLLPVLIFTLVAAYPLGVPAPPGFRAAASRYRRLWAGMLAILAAYALLLLIAGVQSSSASPSAAQLRDFVGGLLSRAAIPAFWGGPWEWVSMGFHAAPNPTDLMRLTAWTLTIGAAGLALYLRPRVWRMLLGAGLYILLSAVVVGLGRAGSALGAPMLRYTFDFALPVVLTAALALQATRWETGAFSRAGQRVRSAARRHPGATRGLAIGLTIAWLLSATVSYVVPWRILPGVTMKSWVDNARTYYPALSAGLLEQPAPSEIVLVSVPLNTFLAADPDAPPEVDMVNDRLLGFDGEGHLIDNDVSGIAAVAPAGECQYQSTAGQAVRVPLQSAVPPGRHTVAFDYLLSTATPVSVALDGEATTGNLPQGAHRSFAVLDGAGSELQFRAENPGASLCILGATVGWIQPGSRVDPASLP